MSDESIGYIRERLGILEAKAQAYHERLDRTEKTIHADLKEMKIELKQIHELLGNFKLDKAYGKGWLAGAVCIGGVVGGLVVKGLGMVF
jgi:hypothetical protein